jgi:hypothetical protein
MLQAVIPLRPSRTGILLCSSCPLVVVIKYARPLLDLGE